MKQTVTESEQRVFISEHRKHSQDTENKVVREILESYKDLFICSLFSDAFPVMKRRIKGRYVNDELERICKETVVA
jgi:hypothetical protein